MYNVYRLAIYAPSGGLRIVITL